MYFIILERFEEDDDSAFNHNVSAVQNRLPIDDMIARTRIPIDFETCVLRIMMSRYFRNQTRFQMATRYVISQVKSF